MKKESYIIKYLSIFFHNFCKILIFDFDSTKEYWILDYISSQLSGSKLHF